MIYQQAVVPGREGFSRMGKIAFDSRGSTERPIWLLVVLNTAAVGDTAMVAVEQQSHDVYDALRTRVLRGGFAPVGAREWLTATWGRSRTSAVDVVRGDLVRITTGHASLYTGGPVMVSPRWLEAARARRALVAVLPPGTLDGAVDDDAKCDRVAALADDRRLLGTMAPVRFDLPVRRPA